MAKLFGFKIENKEGNKNSKIVSPIPKNSEDSSEYYITSGFYGQYIDIEGVYKNEADLVRRYREMALHPECDSAIEDVVNEGIVSDLNDSPVEIELSNLNASDRLKDIIRKEFKYIKEIMDFDKKAHEIFRNWYVDGRLYYHKVIDIKNPSEGIKEIRYIDPLKIKFIRKLKKNQENTLSAQVRSMMMKNNAIEEVLNPVIEEYYLYDPNTGYTATQSSLHSSSSAASKAIKLSTDSITYVTSGLVDRNRQTILSYLHKAIKSLNQLRMIEDSLVIYRLSRSSEKRIFYIDIGGLPRNQAEQYMKDVMNRYRNKLIYDQCLSLNTKIPLLNGKTETLSQIIQKFNKGEKLWAYSCDPQTGKFAPGIISWAGVTRKNEKVLQITLENDKSIICTLDHKFPVWNKGRVEAKDLKVGDSMIPFHTKNETNYGFIDNISNQQIYENDIKKWTFIRELVNKWKDTFGILGDEHDLNIIEEEQDINLINNNSNHIGELYNTYQENHKIKSIDFLEDAIDVGTLTIDRDEIYHNYHTFALEAGIYTCNSTGEIKDDRKYMAMMEDYWLPRRDNGRGTEVQTLPGGQNLGELTDLEYFQKKLYKSLGVPSTRLDAGGGFNLGRSSEILRDELKFTRFVGRLRKRFSQVFIDMLKTQLILKNIVTPEDWIKLSDHIQFDFLYDNHFADLKKNEILNDKLAVISAMDPYIGKYFSVEYVRKTVLGQSDTEIVEIDKQIKKEIKKGIIPDPAMLMQQGMDVGQPQPQPQPGAVGGEALGAPISEPSVSDRGTMAPQEGEI